MGEAEIYDLVADGHRFPNSTLPLLVFRQAVRAEATAVENTFAAHGWTNSWRNGIFRYHHFHSITHEVLGVAAGEASVMFGGPAGRTIDIRAGDAVVIPAGVAHCNVRQSSDLSVIGAYPDGMTYDVRRGELNEYQAAIQAIRLVPLPRTNPVTGHSGDLRDLWAQP